MPDMTDADIKALFDAVWQPGFGSVSVRELAFIQQVIERVRPKRFLEIGMASGLSTGFIARFLAANGGETFHSIDHDDTFFGDPSKPNGFLLPKLYPDAAADAVGDRLNVQLVKFCTSLGLGQVDGAFDMAFVDANHQHPWPAIDTLVLYPRMTGARIVIHHDLRLFRHQGQMLGIGPKYLFDQFPESHRVAGSGDAGNIFYIDLNILIATFEEIMADLFKLPWSLRGPLATKDAAALATVLEQTYSSAFCSHVAQVLAAQNKLERLRSGI